MAFTLAMLDKMTGGEFATVASVAVGAFGVGNAVEHLKKGETR